LNSKLVKFFSSEWVLGILVAMLSVLIAAAAYQSSLFDSKESDFNVEGQKQLTESNSLYLEANQFVIYDYQMYDGWYLNDGTNDDLAQYYLDSFSENLAASMERDGGPFDDQYYTDNYADAESTYEVAMTAYDDANTAGNKADSLQLAVLIYAVGLALAAYGSMLPETANLRKFFGMLSVVGLIFGTVVYIATLIGA